MSSIRTVKKTLAIATYRILRYNNSMKARYQYRIYPTNQQRQSLARLFGCVRVVWNDALAFCQAKYKDGEKKPNNGELSKRLTEIKKTEEKIWLGEVSAIPLQQVLRDLDQAYSNFFQSCKGERKGKKVRPPKFKKRKSKQSARFTDNGFTINQHNVTPVSYTHLTLPTKRIV